VVKSALGMADRIGSITPGKLADLVLLRPDTPSMTPVNNPVGHLAFQAGRGDIDTAVVNGRVKRRGELIGLDLTRARRLAAATRDHIPAGVGGAAWRNYLEPPRRQSAVCVGGRGCGGTHYGCSTATRIGARKDSRPSIGASAAPAANRTRGRWRAAARSATAASVCARDAPGQRWRPAPKARCCRTLARCGHIRSGEVKTSGSDPLPMSITSSCAPAGRSTPPSSTGRAVTLRQVVTGGSRRSTSSTHAWAKIGRAHV
jgi:hypothetical protein